jgi:mannitol/fructose-specific phosphotransferase system IIA component (Ntr-type)
MKSIIDALKDGRLIELPDNNKQKALGYLASIMEAIPELSPGFDIGDAVLKREEAANTALGMGWACPHVRVPGDGELFSSIGWSPAGIDYGAPDGKPVHLLVMFYIPDNQKNAYLKEVSALAKAILKEQGMEKILSATNINDVRNELLNWVSSALDSSLPQAKARIIKLEARQAAAETAATPQQQPSAITAAQILPLMILRMAGGKSVILSQHGELVSKLETADMSPLNENGGRTEFEIGGYKILVRSKTQYQPDRTVYDCLALK